MKRFVSLSTLQLRLISKRLIKGKQIQVGAANELVLFKKPLFGILNNQNSELPGQHWLAIVWQPKSKVLEVFDSFGFSPEYYEGFVAKYVLKNQLKIRYNTLQYQNPDSVMCGYYALYFLKLRSTGLSYDQILKKFNPNKLKQNDLIVKNMFTRFQFPTVKECSNMCYKKCNMKADDFTSICIQRNKKCIKL